METYKPTRLEWLIVFLTADMSITNLYSCKYGNGTLVEFSASEENTIDIKFYFPEKTSEDQRRKCINYTYNYVSQLIERLEWNIKINTLSFDTPLKEDQLVW